MAKTYPHLILQLRLSKKNTLKKLIRLIRVNFYLKFVSYYFKYKQKFINFGCMKLEITLI